MQNQKLMYRIIAAGSSSSLSIEKGSILVTMQLYNTCRPELELLFNLLKLLTMSTVTRDVFLNFYFTLFKSMLMAISISVPT